MTQFGIICPASAGHLNPMIALGCELKQRGHRVTVLGIADVQQKVLAAKLKFQMIGQSDFPPGVTKDIFTQLGKLKGLQALKYTLGWITKEVQMCIRDAPDAIQNQGIEALLVDQASLAGGTVAQYVDVPFISICNALIFNQEVSIPPFSLLWQYNPSWLGLLRNKAGYTFLDRLGKPILRIINESRQHWKLPLYQNFNQSYSRLAQVSQQPAEFEYPRKELPPHFHFTGPYCNPESREAVPFPYERLTEKPLIYASMGTLQNRLLWLFQMIAEACIGLDVQLVIALGGGASPENLELPGNPIVVGYAPQLELLQQASLTITHAGMNTTLESLSNGVPMVAIPITNDQPGVASRLAWTQTGEVIPLGKVNVGRLRQAITQLLTDNIYKKNALKLQEAIKRAGGVSLAADIIEQAIATNKPVLSPHSS